MQCTFGLWSLFPPPDVHPVWDRGKAAVVHNTTDSVAKVFLSQRHFYETAKGQLDPSIEAAKAKVGGAGAWTFPPPILVFILGSLTGWVLEGFRAHN
jgi:hypothetical protein